MPVTKWLALFTSSIPSAFATKTLVFMTTPAFTLLIHTFVKYKRQMFMFTPLISRTFIVMLAFHTSETVTFTCKVEKLKLEVRIFWFPQVAYEVFVIDMAITLELLTNKTLWRWARNYARETRTYPIYTERLWNTNHRCHICWHSRWVYTVDSCFYTTYQTDSVHHFHTQRIVRHHTFL